MAKETLSPFGRLILKYLHERDMFEKGEQADKLNINKSQYSGMLRGKRVTTKAKIDQFSKALSLSKEEKEALEDAALQSNSMVYTSASVKTVNGKRLVGVVIKNADTLPQNVIESIIETIQSITNKN